MPQGGLVVDVGCSDDGRYADLWQPAAETGRARYIGIEPDTARAQSLQQRFPWADVKAIPVESLSADLHNLEAVLVLRSWNHLKDPAAALAPLIAALKPGGLLLIVDNVAFGLCRTGQQRQQAETSTSIWEHFRNDDSQEAITRLAALPIKLIQEIPVTSTGANQWIAEFQKL